MSKTFNHGYALLIGVDENHVSKWALPYAAKDIEGLQRVLLHPERCAYLADNVKVLTGKDATRDGILNALEWLQDRIQDDASGNATAIVYYTGHGWRKEPPAPPNFCLIPYDVRRGQIEARGLPAEGFAAAVGALEPRRLLVALDCCHAGGMGAKRARPLPAGYVKTAIAPALLMRGEKSIGPEAKGVETLAQGSGRAALSSSTGEQFSYPRQDGRMSIFTYHLIEALTGHAQPQAGGTEVLVSDVMSHVYRRVPQSVRADCGPYVEQTPDYQVSGNFPIALLLGGKGLSKGQLAPDPLETPAIEAVQRGYQARLVGNGAIAQGHRAVAAGAGGVAIGGDVQGGVIIASDGGAAGKSIRPRLPARCPFCGASVRPDEVEWLDDASVACAYCKSTIQATA
jgi:hypothetical protein